MTHYEYPLQPAEVYCKNQNAIVNLNGFLFNNPFSIAHTVIKYKVFIDWATEYAAYKDPDSIERTWRMIQAIQECML